MVEARIKSGSVLATTKQFKELITGMLHEAVNEGVEQSLNIYIPNVAKRYGTLRREFRKMILNQLNLSGVEQKIQIEFKELKLPIYGKYHVYGSTGSAITSSKYKHSKEYLKQSPRTVTGTRPINEEEFLLLVFRKIIENLKKIFIQEGLNFRDYTTVIR